MASILLILGLFAGDIATFFPAAPRIVAIGDLHGDLNATRMALRLAGAIDDQDRWIGGDLVVVQTGDQLDRGDDEQAILDLLSRLEEEALAAGGRLHVLNGNHEIMNSKLDFRYVTPKAWHDFKNVAVPDGALQEHNSEHRHRVAAFQPGGKYAKVLGTRNTAVVVGENVFVHGGIHSEHVTYGLERMNQEARDWLKGKAQFPESFKGPNSIIWSRLYSHKLQENSCTELEKTLKLLGAKRMIVGHTIQKEGITSACEGKVWRVDVGMSSGYFGGKPQVLEIKGDQVRIIQ